MQAWNVHFARLPYDTTVEDLSLLLAYHNPIEVSVFQKRGIQAYAFVLFRTHEEAVEVIKTFDKRMFLGRRITVEPSYRQGWRIDSMKPVDSNPPGRREPSDRDEGPSTSYRRSSLSGTPSTGKPSKASEDSSVSPLDQVFLSGLNNDVTVKILEGFGLKFGSVIYSRIDFDDPSLGTLGFVPGSDINRITERMNNQVLCGSNISAFSALTLRRNDRSPQTKESSVHPIRNDHSDPSKRYTPYPSRPPRGDYVAVSQNRGNSIDTSHEDRSEHSVSSSKANYPSTSSP